MKLITRPPVVVVMGHIDHGKSTLLDYIRQSNVAAGEAGGITQAVGAYEVTRDDKRLTFIDTPGHVAFAAMRQHGARVADIAILVVSAEDGVKPQTLEAAKIITESKLPFIVAINKIDKPNANIDRAKQELAENNIFLEGYGGKVPLAAISAKTGGGVPELLDLIVLVAELENLTADPAAPATGFIIEANINPRSGITATVIIKNGTLRRGDFVAAGAATGKVKQLRNFLGQNETALSFSAPALVTGWLDLPEVGSEFASFSSKEEAGKAAAENHLEAKPPPLGGLASKLGETSTEIPIVIRSDTVGGAEAVRHEISKLLNEKVAIKILSAGAGQITENDVKQASGAKNSIVIGFQTKASKSTKEVGERLGVQIVEHEIIYKLLEWLEEEIGRREPTEEVEEVTGRAKVLKIFGKTKDKQVIGGQVTEGKLVDGQTLKILRRDAVIGQGKVLELQQDRLPTREVETDKQFGARLESKVTIAAGDKLEAVLRVKK